MTPHPCQGADTREFRKDDGLELSIWDALMLGHVAAVRHGLRPRASTTTPIPTTAVATRQEVA